MPNQEPAFAWPFGTGPVKVGTQGFSAYAWVRRAFSPGPTDRPRVSEDVCVEERRVRVDVIQSAR